MTMAGINFRKDKDIKNVQMTVVVSLNDDSKRQYYFPNIEFECEVFSESDFLHNYTASMTAMFKGTAYPNKDAEYLMVSRVPKSEELIELKDSGKLYPPPPVLYDLYNIEKGSKMTEIFTEITTRSTAFPKNGGNPIAASVPGYSRIPFKNSTTTLIGVDDVVIYAKTLDEKRDLAFTHTHILVCWPGMYSQDVFYVDDVNALKKALGFVPKKEKTRRDHKGNEWVVAE